MPSAAMSVKFESRGVETMVRRLKVLPGTPARRVVRKATNFAANPILKAARQLVPKETGLLKKSLKKKQRSNFTTDSVAQVIIGPDSSVVGAGPDGRKRRPSNYAHLVELGTRSQPARSFIRAALDQNRRLAVARWIRKARAELRRELAKLAAKGGRR